VGINILGTVIDILKGGIPGRAKDHVEVTLEAFYLVVRCFRW